MRVPARFGWVKSKPKRIPMVSANGGESNPGKDSMGKKRKRIFASQAIAARKNIRTRAGTSNLSRIPVAAFFTEKDRSCRFLKDGQLGSKQGRIIPRTSW